MHIGLGIRMSGNRGAGGGFSPNALFASGEAGDWFDPSDLSRMWQDTAGTTPVTADGQTVARIDGQRGVVSLRQSDAAKRPAYKTSAGLHWLQFDGTNDTFLSAAALNLSGTDKLTLCAGVRKSVAVSNGQVVGVTYTGAGYWHIFAPNAVGTYRTAFGVGAGGIEIATPADYAEPITNVVVGISDAAAPTLVTRVDATEVVNSTSSQGTGNFGNSVFEVGSRDESLFFSGNLYFLLIRGALTSGADLTALEGFAAAKSGVTL